MENLYPLFERNRILKKELLWSLRDYSFIHMQLEYQAYGDGILSGCELEVKEKELVVGKGIIKHNGFIYLLTEAMTIPYEPTQQLEILKMKMIVDSRSEDFISYRIELFLDNNPVKAKDELEVCRFKLRHGSILRNHYKDFADMATEFDTVDVTEADWGAVGGRTLSPAVTGYFAEQILEESGSQLEDISFAYLCVQRTEAVPIKMLKHYVENRLDGMRLERNSISDGEETESSNNRKLFDGMVQILEEVRGNREYGKEHMGKRKQIIVE